MVDFRVSEFNTYTHYISTKQAIDKFVSFFKEHGAERIILVAHPFHLFFIKLLIKSGAWKIKGIAIDYKYDKLMKQVPYDQPSGNVQWWTRDPISFTAYLIKTFFTNNTVREENQKNTAPHMVEPSLPGGALSFPKTVG